MSCPRFRHWPPPSGGLLTLRLRIPPAKIGLVCSILEAYEGVSVVRTTDQEAGLIEIWVMPGQLPAIESVLADLGSRFAIRRLGLLQGHPDLGSNAPGKDSHG